MKVLHIAESAHGGGAESVFKETIVLVQKYDLSRKHFVACKTSDNLPFHINFVFSKGDDSALELIYSKSNKQQLDRFLEELSPDIIHLHHYANLSPSVLHALYNYKKRKAVRILQTVHTFEYACSHHAAYDYQKAKRCLDCGKQTFKTKIFYRNCSRRGYMHSIGKGINSLIAHYFYKKNTIDKIIVPSEFMKQAIMLNKFYQDKEIAVIDNPVSKDFLGNQETAHKKNQIVYFGRLSDEKNIELLILAYHHYIQNNSNSYNLLIIGDGPEKEKLQSLVTSLDMDDRVSFLPFLQHHLLQGHLKESKISVLPSKCFENAPMMVIESLAFDIIPIVSNHGGMKEMVAKFDFGLVFKSEDHLSLSERISFAVSNYDVLFANSNKSKATAKELLTGYQYVNQLDELYGA